MRVRKIVKSAEVTVFVQRVCLSFSRWGMDVKRFQRGKCDGSFGKLNERHGAKWCRGPYYQPAAQVFVVGPRQEAGYDRVSGTRPRPVRPASRTGKWSSSVACRTRQLSYHSYLQILFRCSKYDWQVPYRGAKNRRWENGRLNGKD